MPVPANAGTQAGEPVVADVALAWGGSELDEREDARPGALVRQFARLTAQLLEAGTVSEVLTRVALAAQRLLPAAHAVSVTVRAGDGTFRTPISLHPAATELDQVQYDLGVGPCVDAARMTGPGLAASADLAGAEAWPGFGAAASERGIGSVISTALVPHPGAAGALGALNIYGRRGHVLDVAAQDVALLLATHAALALAHTQALNYAAVQHGRLRRWAAAAAR